MYAYIETGGKQYRVAEGQSLSVERLDSRPGDEVTLDKVLAVIKEDGSVFGNPYVQGASVKAEVVGERKLAKVMVYKQKRRKNYRKLRGHRQQATTLMIKEIQGV